MGTTEREATLVQKSSPDFRQRVFELTGAGLHYLDSARRDRFNSKLNETLGLLTLQETVSFIQIGAHDGDYDDPLSTYLQQPHWQGTLVEPQPDLACKLREKYFYRPNVAILQTAVWKEEGFIDLWKAAIPDTPEASAITSIELGRTRRSLWRLLGPTAVKRATFERLTVPAITLVQLIDYLEVADVDIVISDTEGCDKIIINEILTIMRPSILLFEHLHMTRKDRREIKTKLRNNDYRLVSSHKDTLAVVQ